MIVQKKRRSTEKKFAKMEGAPEIIPNICTDYLFSEINTIQSLCFVTVVTNQIKKVVFKSI
jgi:hypothetical protein